MLCMLQYGNSCSPMKLLSVQMTIFQINWIVLMKIMQLMHLTLFTTMFLKWIRHKIRPIQRYLVAWSWRKIWCFFCEFKVWCMFIEHTSYFELTKKHHIFVVHLCICSAGCNILFQLSVLPWDTTRQNFLHLNLIRYDVSNRWAISSCYASIRPATSTEPPETVNN